jgi:ribonucleotide reductase alpha subunit
MIERLKMEKGKLKIAPILGPLLTSTKTIDVVLHDKDGNPIYEMKGVKAPIAWTDRAITIMAQKYFNKTPGKEEKSVFQTVKRVVDTITDAGIDYGYFDNENGTKFNNELHHILLDQLASFNSPVWFNIGVKEGGFGSACFINSVEDSMESIMDLAKLESRIFKYGSGSGVNVSDIRGSMEPLSNGGTASGPISFMHAWDGVAGAVRSGGVVRRSAVKRIMNADHPDIEEFINCKAKEEEKGRTLIKMGYNTDIGGEINQMLALQNGNNSVRLTDEFMRKATGEYGQNEPWSLIARKTGKEIKSVVASKLLQKIAKAVWECGEPCVQFHDATNKWHTTPSKGEIKSANPCLPKDATVLTPYGMITLEQLKEGDTIWSGKQWTIVTKKWSTGIKSVYRYLTSTGEFISTDNHIVISKGERIEVGKAQYIDRSIGPSRKYIKKMYEIKEVIYRGEEEVFDITVDAPEHTFWCNGFLVSNCSEFVHVPNTACNLSSVNLVKALGKSFNYKKLQHVVEIMIIAQDILVDLSGYPSQEIADNSHDLRPLGLGYTDLGAYLMLQGLAYDSDEARTLTSMITSLLTASAYNASTKIADCMGSFKEYVNNSEDMHKILEMHKCADNKLNYSDQPDNNFIIAYNSAIHHTTLLWNKVVDAKAIRNSVVTLLAPTGTISFIMDADTTGMEPLTALRIYKQFVGGAYMAMVPSIIVECLQNLKYDETEIKQISEYIAEHGDVSNCDTLKPEHQDIFLCAFHPTDSSKTISWEGHLKMMEAIQPFISGAQSKTINLPNDATPEDIEKIYIEAWKMGLKSVSVYRDGSKYTQPLNTKKIEAKSTEPIKSGRRKLPKEREALTHKYCIAGSKGYITVGKYEDGTPGELFITMSKEGSIVSGLLDCVATVVSFALQYGVPLKSLIKKLSYTRFEPSGFTENTDVKYAYSIIDYIMRWLDLKFYANEVTPKQKINLSGPSCIECGALTQRSGTCYLCPDCGSTTGCS